MDENHQDKTGNNPTATKNTLWLPPLSLKDQKKLKHFQKKPFTVRTGLKGKTLWDWLQLLGVLAIPLVVAGATLLFSIQQANLAQQQHENEQKIAQQQHEADKQSALDQQEATILQTYIDNIQDLLLNHHLLKSKSTDEEAILARARTLTALRGLDPQRKGVLVNFLYEAKLIGYYNPDTQKNLISIIDLSGADLSGANLGGNKIGCFDLGDPHATINPSNPSVCIILPGADLSGANLSSANLIRADLNRANLIRADLSGANLSGANLYAADLNHADLSGANLSSADLIRADLTDADLTDAVITQHQLDQVYSCKNAILPLTCHHNQ